MRPQALPSVSRVIYIFFIFLLAASWALFPVSVRAAESYDNCTGFIDSIPATISTQGTWCLRRDLSTSISSGNAILIAANNVILDCNDFKIGNLSAGVNTQTNGIHIPFASIRNNATIRRCNIRGFCRGIRLNGSGHLVEDNRMDSSRCTAISTGGDNNIVRNNMIMNTQSPNGFASGYQGDALFTGNTISGVSASADEMPAQGITTLNQTGTLVEVSNNTIRGLRATGTNSVVSAILTSGSNIVIKNNRVFGDRETSSAPRRGIVVNPGGHVVCRDNVFSRFDTTIEDCAIADGNHVLP